MNTYNSTQFLDLHFDKVPAKQRQYHIDNGIYELKLCQTCQTVPVNWNPKEKAYRRFCSSKCAHASEEVKKKTETTCMERFGAKTNLQTIENKEKQKKTCIQKYGVDNFAKTKEFKEKSKITFMNRFGVDNPSKSPEIKDKITDTHQRRYGRKRHSQLIFDDQTYTDKNNIELMSHLYHDEHMTIKDIASILGVGHSQLVLHFKNNLGFDIRRRIITSAAENTISSILIEHGVEVVKSDRTILGGKELDILIPSCGIAIEFNGLFWHSENAGNKHMMYHFDKSKSCADAGIHLIHVMDYEYRDYPDIVISRLLSKVGKSSTVYARKTYITELDNRTASNFLEANHIQHASNSSVRYGLILNGELVAAMTFGKSRFDRKYDYELLRYCNKLGTTVVGGASKLFNHFVRMHKPKSVVSYSDNRWNAGDLYGTLGFRKINNGKPNYWYTFDYLSVESRLKYQKHKLSRLLPVYDSALTEWQNMQNNGYDRVWDCGSSKWLWCG